MVIYSDEQKVTLLATMLLGIASAAKGTGLDDTIKTALNDICPVESAMIEARGYGYEKAATVN